MLKNLLKQNKEGFTLVEVVAAVLLIGIISITFIGIFIQTSKTRVTSEEIINSTYIAQQEMESFYAYSKANKFNIETIARAFPKYKVVGNELVQITDTLHYKIIVRFDQLKPNLYSIIIEVSELQSNNQYVLKSKMENIYIWGGI